jgi:hypothetical protein
MGLWYVNGVAYDSTDPEQRKEYRNQYMKIWREKNKEKFEAIRKKSYLKAKSNPEFVERCKKCAAEWNARNREKLNERLRAYAYKKYHEDEEFRQKRKEYMKAYYRNKKEKGKEAKID